MNHFLSSAYLEEGITRASVRFAGGLMMVLARSRRGLYKYS